MQTCRLRMGGQTQSSFEVQLLPPSREPMGFTLREKGCSVFVEATGWCAGRVRSQWGLPGGGGAGAGPRRTVAQVSANRIRKSLFPKLAWLSFVALQPSQLGSLAVRTLGEGESVPSCLSFSI